MSGGILAVWSDVDAAGEDDYTAWYEREHLFERLVVPGFQQGRHYVTLTGAPKYFTYFVTDHAAVVASPAYLAQANRPSPWTRRVLPSFRNTNRTACDVLHRFGRGYGALSITVRMAAMAGRDEELLAWLAEALLPALVQRPGILSAQLWRADREATLLPVADRHLRPQPDQVADLVIFVEGTVLQSVEAAAAGPLALANLEAHGAELPLLAIHQFLHGADNAETRIPQSPSGLHEGVDAWDK